MLITLQFPLVDVRRFLKTEVGILKQPLWPAPVADRDFVRSFGIVRRRWRGGLSGWIGESEVVEARRALRFRQLPPYLLANPQAAMPLQLTFKRFYSDGEAVAKLEVGLSIPRAAEPYLPNPLPAGLLHHILDLPVTIPNPIAQPTQCTLWQAGPPLAALYGFSSARLTGAPDAAREKWWVQAGAPILLLEYTGAMSREWPWGGQRVNLANYPDALLTHHILRKGGKGLRLWLLKADTLPREEARKLRITLLRLHCEKECLKLTLALLASGRLDISPQSAHSDELQRYLNTATRRILRMQAETETLAEEAYVELAQRAEEMGAPGERESILAALDRLGIRRNIYSKVAVCLDRLLSEKQEHLRQARATEEVKIAELRRRLAELDAAANPLAAIQIEEEIKERTQRIRDLEYDLDQNDAT